MLRSIFLFSCFTFWSTFVSGVTISGQLIDENNKFIEFANVAIHDIDSNLISGDISDEFGLFSITLSHNQLAYIQLYLLGYEVQYISLIDADFSNNIELGHIQLVQSSQMLDEVVISEHRAFIERHLDKLVVNVENSIVNAGANALEVLEKSPGVFIDQNGGISLNGQTGVRIMMDNKAMTLSGTELISFLQSLPSSTIEKIEIISNPSAKYDAEGTSGIINLVRNRQQSLGTNGSFNSSYGKGLHHRVNSGIRLNHRNEKSNFYGSYQYGYNESSNNLLTYRRFLLNGQVANTYDQDATILRGVHSHGVNLGYDYFTSKKTTIGVLVNSHIRTLKPKGDGRSDILDAHDLFIGGFSSTNRSDEYWENYAFNGNVQHKFNSKGKSLQFDLDYAQYNNTTDQFFTTQYYDENNLNTDQEKLRGDIVGSIRLYSAKLDLTLPTASMGTFETGLKTSLVKNDNDLKYFDQVNGQDILDENQSNHFLYDEQIHAAYVTWGNTFNKWQVKLGLRTEKTIAEGRQLTTNNDFDRNYTQVFPSVFINYVASENHTFNMNIGRRINRPSYRQLNPFRSFVDVTTARDGNPFLRPETSINAELGYTYKQRYTAMLTYAQTKDNIIIALLQDDIEKIVIVSPVNIGRYNYMGLNLSGSFELIKNLSSRFAGNIFYNEFVGQVSNTKLDAKNTTFDVNLNNSYRFGKGWSGELNFFYRPQHQYGISHINTMWRLDAGLQKSIMKRKGSLRLSVRDMFWKFYPSGYTGFGNIDESFDSIRDTRVASFSFTYQFGNQKISPARRRQSGAEDEKRRAS